MSGSDIKIICYWCGKIMDVDTRRCSRCGGSVSFTSCRVMNCPACNKDVSFKARICPKCGHPITEKDVNEYADGKKKEWERSGEPRDLGLAKPKEDKEKVNRGNQIQESQGCFIATAVFDSFFAPETVILREFRDKVLNKFILGRLFVTIYYWLSPSAANFLKDNEVLKGITRKLLTLLIQLAKCFNKIK